VERLAGCDRRGNLNADRLIPRYFLFQNGAVMSDEIHTGGLIRKQMEKEGREAEWLADQIGCVPDNIYWIWRQKYIDPEQLIKICFHLETDFFAHYSEYIRQRIPSSDRKYIVGENIHIGILIQSKMNEEGRKTKWLAKNIHRSRSQVYRMYDYKHIKTELLISISILLKTDFFSIYSEYVNRKIREKCDKL